MAVKTDMREALLAAGRAAVQAGGYNALSFRDLAEAVGIKSASVHYHFPTKGDLAAALARRYTDDGAAALEQMLTESRDPGRLMARYTDIFRAALLDDNRMCLIGMLSAELEDLPTEVRDEVARFADMNVAWIARVLALMRSDLGPKPHAEKALAIFTAIEGAQLVARGRQDVGVYDRAIAAYRATGLMP